MSDYRTEGVLSMEYENDRKGSIIYLLKSLHEIKRNYEIYNKEMLVIIRRLENWRHLLENAC